MLSLAAIQTTAFGGFGGAAPKKAAAPAFAYGLPGNFNALGGAELNFDPAGFLEARAHSTPLPDVSPCAPIRSRRARDPRP